MIGDEAETEERERWLQAEREANEIEAGSLICPCCQRYADPAQWWTHIDKKPYEEVDPYESSLGPTLFHRGCAAPIPEKNVTWVKALRKCFTESPIRPGDYVQLTRPRWPKVKTGVAFRVFDIETDEHVGVTDDNPYYVLDISESAQRYQSRYCAQKREFEVVGRPYLKG